MSDVFHLVFKPGERALDWKFQDPDTGFLFKANTRHELVQQILLYRTNNQLEQIENLDAVIDEYLCRQPENISRCRPLPLLKRSFLGFWKGGIMLLKSLRYQVFASQEEAEKRAEQCRTCKFNVIVDKPRAIKYSDALAEAVVGQRRVKCQKELGNCSVCSCPLKAKVHYLGEVSFTDQEKAEMETVNCWQLKLPEEK